MLERIVESFFIKVGEKLADFAQDKVTDLGTLERNFKSLCAKASDIEEKIKNAELLGKRKRKREVEDWLKQVQVIETDFLKLENEVQSRGFVSRFLSGFLCGDRAEEMNQRINELVEQSRHFGELLLDVHETKREPLLTIRLVGEAFEENLDKILKMLVIDKASSIGIYGMGGVGKTTLTKHIYNRLLRETQGCVIWVIISQIFSIKKLQDEIARAISLDLSDEYDEDKRAAKLNGALSLRSGIVLILDDVWKNINLQKVGYPLHLEGFRLIITTRSLEVCRQIGCQEIIEVKTLHPHDAWDLFIETLGQETNLAPDVQEIAVSMVEMCDGLPLGIITLAGSMRGETAIHVWRNALTELEKSVMGQDDMEDQVFKVLKYSFDRLDPNNQQGICNRYTILQLCFLYCSLYPEDYRIRRDELIKKFISEELVDKRKSTKAQFDEGHSILDKLVNICLLESTHTSKPGDSVKMHDLIRAMALKITEGKTMAIAGHSSMKEIPSEEEWTKDLENVSLMCNNIEEIPLAMSPNCPKLTTLLLQNNSSLKLLSDSFFSRMHALCTLDLSRTIITELPNSLSNLESLKVLLLGDCRKLVYVPDLGKLKALRELDLSNSAIKEVPQGMENLVNLKYLSMSGVNNLNMFPTGLLCNFQNLRLLLLPYQIQTPLEEVKRLKQLEEFKGPVENVCDFSHFVRTRQNRVHNTFYSIQVGSNYDMNFSRGPNQVVLHRHNLEKAEVGLSAQDVLIFHQCDGLRNCSSDDFSQLDDPSSLKMLKFSNSRGIQCLLTHGHLTTQESKFSCLEKIVLSELPDFTGVIHKREIEAAAFASPPPPPPPPKAAFSYLKCLTICLCNKVKKLGLPASEIPNLEKLCVQRCYEIQEIIETAGEAPLVSLRRLKELYLIQLPRLTSICNATMVCNSMETIHMEECRALKKLSLYFPPSENYALHGQSCNCSAPPALKEIWAVEGEREWWESLEWEHPTHYHLIQPFLRFWD